jgi:two-component system sensor histidine kinase/response regulator
MLLSCRIRPLILSHFLALCLLLATGFCVGLASAQNQTQPQVDLTGKTVLILHEIEYNVPILIATNRALMEVLESGGIGIRNQFYENLDFGRHPEPEHRKKVVELLRQRYSNRQVDLIVTTYAGALNFALNEGLTIFHEVPIIALYVAPGMEIPKSNRVIIRHSTAVDPSSTLESALKLLPRTKQVYVVSGAHVNDKRLENLVRQEFKKWEGRLEFFYLSNLPMEKILTTVSSLPESSIVLLPSLQTDVLGTIFTTREVVRRVSQSSNAPVFGLVDVGLGYGLVGGYLISYELMGRKAGELGLEILRSGIQNAPAYPKNIEVRPIPMYDGRQLKRWGLSPNALPKGSIIINREVTFWDFKYYIIGGVMLCLLEAFLIARLLIQKRRRKAAEQSLQQRTEELDQFFNVTLDILAIASTKGYFLRLNPTIEKVLGHTREELMAKRFLEFVHPDDVDRTMEAVSRLASQEKVSVFENRYRCKDGTYRWLQWSSTPVGNFIYAAARDVTENKQAEKVLHESELKYRTLYESMRDAFVKADMTGRIQEFNAAYQEMVGYGDEELRRMTYLDLTPEKWHAFEARIVEEQILRYGFSDVYEKEYLKKNGTVFPVEVRKFLVQDASGEPEGTWAIIRDIADRKRSEEELSKYQEHLEEMVRERTAELSVATEQAEFANRAKSTFLANMSHELRTPLNSILGIAQLMQRDAGFPREHRETLKVLSRSGTYLLELINDVLELSKIEAGKTTLVPVSFDLHSFLGDLEEMMRLRAEQKGLDLVFEEKAGLPRNIETDVRKLRQILMNLLSNAVKFTEKGRITLRVGVKERTEKNAELNAPSAVRLEFEIEDTGIGIAPLDTHRIFEPFVQVNPVRSAREGTGLGLTLSRMFIELLGGEITVRSQAGKGSTFAFSIPVKQVESTMIHTEEAARQVIGLVPGQPAYCLLVVDDSFENRFTLRRLLEQVGFIILEADSGQAAVDMVTSHQPHLVWMDLRMPGMNGGEAARKIREAEKGIRGKEGREIHTPIIALTAGVMENIEFSSHSRAFDDWVFKPYREKEIFDMLEKHLGVQFIYKAPTGPLVDLEKGVGPDELTPADLSVLPAEWLREFFQILRRGRTDLLLELIGRIPPAQGNLSEKLAELTRFHRLDKLIPITREALAEKDNGRYPTGK